MKIINSVEKKNYKTVNTSNDNIENNISNPILKPEIYFQSANNFANVNIGLMKAHKYISFQGRTDFYNKEQINNSDIQGDCLEVNCHNIYLDGNVKLEKITAGYGEDPLELFDSEKGNVELHDNVHVRNVDAKSVIMKDNTQTNDVKAEYLGMFDSAQAESVNSSNIELRDSSIIKNINSEDDLTLYGEGSIGNIQCKGSKIFITGPLKINGKIKFETSGDVYLLKDRNNKYANISKGVENGRLLFQTDNNLFIDNQSIFGAGIYEILKDQQEAYYKKQLGDYRNIDSLKFLYTKSDSDLAEKLKELSSNGNQRKVELLYNKFLESTLQTLAGSRSKEFTTFWVNNKKIGNNNLVDFWFKALGKNIENTNAKEKAEMLNSLTKNEKERLINVTTKEYIKNVLPIELDRKNNQDLKELDNADNFVFEIVTQIQQNPRKEIKDLIKDDGYKRLENIKIGNKNIIDLWIDTIDGDNEASGYTARQKKARLEEIFENSTNIDKIVKAIIIGTSKENNNINEVQKIYTKLIEDSEIPAPQKNLLQEYSNSRIFYSVITGKWIDKTSKAKLEKDITETVGNLINERRDIEQNSRKNIFNQVKDINNIYQYNENSEMLDKINFIFSILNTKIEKSNKFESATTKNLIKEFQKEVEQNPENIANTWSKLVDEAQRYYETTILDTITTKKIELLNSMNNRLVNEQDSLITDAVTNKSLDKTEQKEFISRYKDDKNLKIMLQNSGVNKREAIDELLYLESINQQIFKAQSKAFIDNIGIEAVKINEDLANRYISVLGKDHSSMSIHQKTEFLDSIAPEELRLASKNVYNKWEKDDLTKFMSEKFVEVDHKNNINVQGKHIVNELKQVNTSLDKIYVDINGQKHTLEELSINFEKFSDMHRIMQEAQYTELCDMAKQLAAINKNTLNIEANAKALVRNVLRNADPLLREEIKSLLPEEDMADISKFLEKVDKQAKEEKDAKRKKQLLLIAAAIAAVVTAGAIAYVAAPALLGAGATGAAASTGISSSAVALNAVHSATIYQATGSALLKNSAISLISFGLNQTMQALKDRLRRDSNPALYALASRITVSTTPADVAAWVAAAGGWWST